MAWSELEPEVCRTIEDVLEASLGQMRALKEQGYAIHHVAGPISADGDEHISRNLAELLRQRDRVARRVGQRAVVITSPTVFTEAIYTRLGAFQMETDARELMFRNFWRKLIGAKLIDCIHFAPGFERSTGTMDEHQAAQEFDVAIHYIADDTL